MTDTPTCECNMYLTKGYCWHVGNYHPYRTTTVDAAYRTLPTYPQQHDFEKAIKHFCDLEELKIERRPTKRARETGHIEPEEQRLVGRWKAIDATD